MNTEEKLKKIKELADKMYSRMAYLTSDTRPIREAMDEYHQFIINEYHKEEPTIPEIVDEHFYEMLGEEPVSEELEGAIGDYCSNPDNFATWIGGEENDDIPLIVKAIKFGAKWKEQQMTKKATDGQLENGEDYLRIKCLSMSCQPQDDGKLVKLIIIKED